jgi:hypothetical protein
MDDESPQSEVILYQTEDGQTRIQCRFESETIWLTQALIAELFQVTPQNVTLHLKAIYAEGELTEAATCKEYLQVRSEGGRQVSRQLRHYSLRPELGLSAVRNMSMASTYWQNVSKKRGKIDRSRRAVPVDE